MSEVTFTCNLSESCGELPHFWEHTVGSGHAALALRADWQAQMRRCHDELGFRHVRFHALLSDSMGTLIGDEGKLLYSFHNADQIFDFLVSIGMKPFVELSFMPEVLASGHKTVFHYRANVTPPAHYSNWGTLVSKLARHWLARYGKAEVRSWFFEVWNEPNLKSFWPGSQANYFKLYRITAQALKEVDSRLQVGGPATANDQWIDDFIKFTTRHRVPVDFISTHHYPTDAFGTEDQDTQTQLAQSQRSVLRKRAQDTHRRAAGLPLFYTEWNTSSNSHDPLHDGPYAAPVIIKTMMEARGLVKGYSYWTFSDIFSENYFPSQPFHGGFGLLNLHGIAKPSYRAFELLHRLGHEQILVDGMHPTLDCWAVRAPGTLTLLVTNHALPRHPIATERVELQVRESPPPHRIYLERIDETHANAQRTWDKMGKPPYPSPQQVQTLDNASRLKRQTLSSRFKKGTIHLALTLPPHAVAAITVEFHPHNRGGDIA